MPRNVRSRCAAAHITLDFQGGAGQHQTGGCRLLFSPVVGLAHRTDIPPRLEIGPMVSSPAGAVKPAVPGKKAAAERCSAAVSFGFTGPATPPAGGD